MKKEEAFSIVIPVYNEEGFLKKSISNLIKKIKNEKNLAFFKYEILLIENGSRDKSLQECEELVKKYNFIKNYQLNFSSYGQAIKTGILRAHYPLVVIFNVDFWDVDFLKKALRLIDRCEIVTGSKTLIPTKDQRPWYRSFTTYFFNALLKIVFNFPGTDTHGLKVMKREKVLPLAKRCYAQNELFDTELILRACKQKLVLTELPVDVKEIRSSRYNNIKRIYNTLGDLLIIFKFKYLNGLFYR